MNQYERYAELVRKVSIEQAGLVGRALGNMKGNGKHYQSLGEYFQAMKTLGYTTKESNELLELENKLFN